MSKSIRVTLQLDYYRDEREFASGIEFASDEEFREYVLDCVHEDIWELVRGSDVESWAEVEWIDE
jgi:hypothetical protein